MLCTPLVFYGHAPNPGRNGSRTVRHERSATGHFFVPLSVKLPIPKVPIPELRTQGGEPRNCGRQGTMIQTLIITPLRDANGARDSRTQVITPLRDPDGTLVITPLRGADGAREATEDGVPE